MIIHLSLEPESRIPPGVELEDGHGTKVMHFTKSVWPIKLCVWWHVSVFQQIMVLSHPPENNRLPVELSASDVAGELCPLYT